MNRSNSPGRNAVVIGAAHVDRRAHACVPFRPGASNPGRMVEVPGGAAFNAALALVGIGVSVTFVGAPGGDANGMRAAEAITAAGFDDRSITWLDRASATYTAVLDDRRELVAGVADMAIYEALTPKLFTRQTIRAVLKDAEGLLLGANLPSATIAHLTQAAAHVPTVAIGVSPEKTRRLRPSLADLSAVVLSRAEAASLVEATEATGTPLLAELLAEAEARRAVITDRPHPATILDGATIPTQQPPAVVPKDVTGAGDTLAGVVLAGMMAGREFAQAARSRIVAASIRISEDPFPPADLIERLASGAAALADPAVLERQS